MRPPPARPIAPRSQSAIPSTRYGAISPADTLVSASASSTPRKRKERDFDHDGGQETNINVVVRCRGRNEREVRENSGVVLSTEGVRGSSVELTMGPSALSNKTYHFDKVFSSAADQSMIYDDVVTPMLDEMLAGFNCTIFAYGQTGTGKTYTMSGDMNDTLGMLSDAAGIIPRVLYALFNKLEMDDAEASIKCSFIELYNEELRDLISLDDSAKLKIYEDNSGKGKSGTIVQGMEECHIKSAVQGVKLLQAGSHKRQVAATKCNDLSSRSHTVFTITAYIKRQGDNGEDYVSAGKLNLVDLAGSENIQRSGAENKRAAEAGLINKSLLTLGRVINALVDRGSHIPYRESKLTRLLQDSLGGQTKTCIIATVSPAKSNLEETISTLDYAFRAKNIRNKPQINAMINKKTLLKEFTSEIEKLKSELIATRQRNGVYLTNEIYEEMTVESESRRILSEELAEKVEAMEANLKNKVQELFSLTSNLMKVKKDHEDNVLVLDETKTLLEQTEFVLSTTRKSLAEEAMLRRAHQETEKKLNEVGTELLSTLGKTVNDIDGLHSKNRRKSDLHSLNRNTWGESQAQVADVTSLVESRFDDFRSEQEERMCSITSKMSAFVEAELAKLSSTQNFLQENSNSFESSEKEVTIQTERATEEMNNVLEEIKTLREDVKIRVGEGLEGLSVAAKRISEEVVTELGNFHTQLHGSYASLGKDFKALFEDLLKHMHAQRDEVNQLRQQLSDASETAMKANVDASSKLDQVLLEEREQAAIDRQSLLSQISSLINSQGQVQDARLASKVGDVQRQVMASKDAFEIARFEYGQKMDSWNVKDIEVVDGVLKSRESLKSKLKEDWMLANTHNDTLQSTTKSVHEETVRIVDAQMKDISNQMQALDDFVTRARQQNSQHHSHHIQSLQSLTKTVRASNTSIFTHFTNSYERVRNIGDEINTETKSISAALSPLTTAVKEPLSELRTTIIQTKLNDYLPTGETPQKTSYLYPTILPRTDDHSTLLAKMRGATTTPLATSSPSKSNTIIFQDAIDTVDDIKENTEVLPITTILPPPNKAKEEKPTDKLREIHVNISSSNHHISSAKDNKDVVGPTSLLPSVDVSLDCGNTKSENNTTSSIFKRSIGRSGLAKGIKRPAIVTLEGRENLSASVGSIGGGRRRSPRMGTGNAATGSA